MSNYEGNHSLNMLCIICEPIIEYIKHKLIIIKCNIVILINIIDLCQIVVIETFILKYTVPKLFISQ